MSRGKSDRAFLDNLPIVDAHHHYWDLNGPVSYSWLQTEPWLDFRYSDYGRIRQSYLPADYRRDAGAHNVVATVHMEAEARSGSAAEEIAWLSALESGRPAAAVAQIRLDRDDVDAQLAALKPFEMVRAVRHKPRAQSRAGAVRGARGSMDDPVWREGYARLEEAGLHFELQTPFWHLDAASDLAADLPKTRIVLNHGGLPADRSEEGLDAWRRAMGHLARQENVFVKASGIGLANGRWPVEQNAMIVREVVDIFGSDRTMFASNFPVDKLCVDMDTLWSTYKSSVADLPERDIEGLFAGTACRVYGIALPEA